MSKTEKSVFETLSAINVNDKVEQKNGLTYLSWAWAWAEKWINLSLLGMGMGRGKEELP